MCYEINFRDCRLCEEEAERYAVAVRSLNNPPRAALGRTHGGREGGEAEDGEGKSGAGKEVKEDGGG